MWMTDEAYTMHETNRERAIVRRSAAHRKCGAKSKACSLPSDGMTRRQWERRNGEVITYNLSKPMTYVEYKRIPEYEKGNYLRNCLDNGGSVTSIARMLGVSDVTARKLFVEQDVPTPGRGAGKSTISRDLWSAFISQDDTPAEPAPAEEDLDITHAEPIGSKAPEKIAPSMGVVTLNGTLPEICGWLLSHLGEGRYAVSVDFTRLMEGGDA